MTSLRVYYCALLPWIAPCNGIQEDSLGFWIPYHGFQIPGTGFQSLSVELGSWIPKRRIPDSTGKNFPKSGIRIYGRPGISLQRRRS